MMKRIDRLNRIRAITSVILMLVWAAQLLDTDAYYVVYLMLSICTCMCFIWNLRQNMNYLSKEKNYFQIGIMIVFSIVFTCMVAFSNYSIWSYTFVPEGFSSNFRLFFNLIKTIAFFVGGFIAFWNILLTVASLKTRMGWKENSYTDKAAYFFWGFFLLLLITRFVILFFCLYPGVLTGDGINQLKQVLTEKYRNHHPYYHTMVIRLFVMFGLKIFNSINAAVALYSISDSSYIHLLFNSH